MFRDDSARAQAWFAEEPWRTRPVALPHRLAGMLGVAEEQMFYFLAKEYFAGRGVIVDAGSYLGRSAYAFAQGLRANPAYRPERDRVHCFDLFVVLDDLMMDMARDERGNGPTRGQSTRAVFERQVAPVRDVLDVHEGDFLTVQWPRQPVEILMVDVAKSVQLGKRIVDLFFPCLVPGVSIVVQQDDHHAWLPHLHVVMEHLADCFEIAVRRVDATAVFLLTKEMPPAALERARAYDFTVQEQIDLMGRAIRRLPAADRAWVELARIVLLLLCGVDPADVRRELAALQRRCEGSETAAWRQQSEHVASRFPHWEERWATRRRGRCCGTRGPSASAASASGSRTSCCRRGASRMQSRRSSTVWWRGRRRRGARRVPRAARHHLAAPAGCGARRCRHGSAASRNGQGTGGPRAGREGAVAPRRPCRRRRESAARAHERPASGPGGAAGSRPAAAGFHLTRPVGAVELAQLPRSAIMGGMLTRVAVAIACCGAAVSQTPATQPAKVDFQKQIAPILVERCIGCHGPKEQKGDLRLDTKEHAFAAREEDVHTVVPGKPDDSEVVRRINLPADDEDVMPAKGGPLTAEQQELVRRWVAEGAEWPATGDQFLAKELAARVLPKITFELPAVDAAGQAAIDAAVAELKELGAVVQPVAADTQALDANLSLLRDKVGDAQLALLVPLAPRLVWLDISRTAATDAGFAHVGKLTQLRRLQAASTAAGDAAIVHLAPLARLEHVNLHGTRVTDRGLAGLAGIATLRRLYLWQTAATAEGAAALRRKLPELQIDLGDYAAPRLAAAEQEIAERALRNKPVNDVCPVADKPVDPAFTLEHEGRRIGFCCAKCRAAFEKEPAKYAGKLPAAK